MSKEREPATLSAVLTLTGWLGGAIATIVLNDWKPIVLGILVGMIMGLVGSYMEGRKR